MRIPSRVVAFLVLTSSSFFNISTALADDTFEHFNHCANYLESKDAANALACLSTMEQELRSFRHQDEIENKFIGSYWLVYGLTHIIEGDFYEGNHAFEEASRFYNNEMARAYLEDEHLDHADSFEQLQEIRYSKALAAAKVGLASVGVAYSSPDQSKSAGAVKARTSNLPDWDVRLVIFTEVGLRQPLIDAGYDELDRDMLFMKSGLYPLEDFMAAYEGKFDAELLNALSVRTHRYYEVKKRQEESVK